MGRWRGSAWAGTTRAKGRARGLRPATGRRTARGRWGQANSKAGNGLGKSGNRGRGNGRPSPEEEAVDYKVKGESVAEFAEVAQNSEQQASEAIENNQVPRELQNAVKTYFGRLNAKVKGEKPATEPAPK